MEKLVTITNKDLLNDLRDRRDIKKVYPLKFFCTGYDITFDIDEIDDFVLINRILNNKDIDELSKILTKGHFKGIIFEDLGILDIIKDMDITKILLLDHILNSSVSINYYLDYVTSVVVSSDITYDEIKNIVDKCKKKVVLYVFGLKKLMYSRRTLLTNYNTYENLEDKKELDAKINDKEFKIKEDQYGTSFFAKKYYNGLDLLNLDALYYWYDIPLLDSNVIIDILDGKVNIDTSRLFLDKETIYKLREDK